MTVEMMGLEKFGVRLQQIDDWPPVSMEWLWGKRVGEDQLLVDNVPFYAKELACGDLVEVEKVEEGDGYWWAFRRVLKRSGRSTYRLFVFESIETATFAHWWKQLESLGCTYEGANEKLIAVDIPRESNIDAIYKVFEEGEAAAIWEFEEGYFAGRC